MEQEMKDKIAENAEVLGECFKQMKENIPNGLMVKDLKLGAAELQSMAVSLFISVTKKGNGYSNNNHSKDNNQEPSSNNESNGSGNYDGESTPGQHKLINDLVAEVNKLEKGAGDGAVENFLNANNKDTVEALDKSEASSLATTLIGTKKELKESKKGKK